MKGENDKTLSKCKLYIAGDSTVSSYKVSRAPRAGWGQVIDRFFTDDIMIINKAFSGRSSKSFYQQGRLDEILKEINEEDYLFIQFGHNDQKDDRERYTSPFNSYQSYLTKYIEGAREQGAYPVLLTPVQRRGFDGNSLINTHDSYPDSMIELAKKLDVPLINMTEKTRKLFEELGKEKTKDIFLWLEPGEYPNYPDGIEDNIHFCQYGAIQIAELVVKGIYELELPLSKYIKF